MCLAVPGQIVSIVDEGLLKSATVDFGGVRRPVSLACVPEATEGDWVLVHVGMALNVIDEVEAHETLALIDEIAS